MKESTEQRPVLPPISDVAAERSNDPDGFIWQRLDQELERLLDLDDPRSRSEHLELLRIRDAELAAQLESMLVSADDDFLERPCELCVPALSALEDPAEGFEPQQWLGRTVGNWKLEDLLGAGGMGAVFRARRADGQFVQVAALKMLALEHEGFGGRFLAERQILARLEHPNIARLIDGGVSPEGRPFLVTELVEGEPIDRWAQAGEIDLEARLKAFQQVCDAVEAAHRSLIVHRDIKPANVMVSPIAPVSGGRQVSAKVHVKLLDFGVARLLSAEDPRGFDDRAPLTPGFAAPE
jgi:serine/threonine-protein kinase